MPWMNIMRARSGTTGRATRLCCCCATVGSFGAERALIPSLAEATPRQLRTLRMTEDGAFLMVPACDLHINVDGLVTRLLEGSPAALRRSAARSAGATTSAAKTAAARRNGRLGGRPRKAA